MNSPRSLKMCVVSGKVPVKILQKSVFRLKNNILDMLKWAPVPKKLKLTGRMELTNSQGYINFHLVKNWHVPTPCQFSPRQKLTWPRTMLIFAQPNIDMVSHHVDFCPAKNWQAPWPCIRRSCNYDIRCRPEKKSIASKKSLRRKFF